MDFSKTAKLIETFRRLGCSVRTSYFLCLRERSQRDSLKQMSKLALPLKLKRSYGNMAFCISPLFGQNIVRN